MTYQVKLSAFAIEDLIALQTWLIGQAGDAVAAAYLDRVKARIAALADFPYRGAPRDDLAKDLRTLSFERRLLIGYKVEGQTVIVLRIINAQRDLGMSHEC